MLGPRGLGHIAAARLALAVAVCALVGAVATGCTRVAKGSQESTTIRVAIGTQDATINCATGGLIIRELHLLEKYLPKEGPYAKVHWDIVWKDFPTGVLLTGEMLGDKIDLGSMADFPSILNAVAFKKQGRKSTYIATLSEGIDGAGNGIVVPVDSPAQTLADLRGKQISVPFGSAAHGMLLRAISDLGWDAEKDVTILAQTPEVGGSSLKARKIDAHADFVPFVELFPFRGVARKIYDGSSVKRPTFHGSLVNADYAKKYPEVVVAFLEAEIEADRIFRDHPEKYSELIEKVAGVEAEVDYMFHGPLGIQTRDFTIKPEVRQGLQIAIDTLKLLKKTDVELSVDEFVDERFIRQAAKLMGVDYDARLKSYDPVPLGGFDARTGDPIRESRLAAQVWMGGEEKVGAFATPQSALAAYNEAQRSGKKVRVALVHDRNTGAKLLAKNAWYVASPTVLTAFLLKEDARAWARTSGGSVLGFDEARGTL
jgi:NitT/TauT family transport system substrate-binding protein